MRLRAGVVCCLLLSVMVLLLPVITTAQSDQEITHRIDKLELIPTEEELTDEESGMEELTTEEEGSVSFTVSQGTETTLILNSVGTFNGEAAPEQAMPQTSFVPGEAIRYVARIKNTGSSTVTASLNYLVTGSKEIYSLIDDIAIPPDPPEEGWNVYVTTTVPTDAPSGTYTLRVIMTINGQSSTKESSFTVVGDSGLPPAAPSNVQAVEITHEGRLSTEVSWTDNADNEIGFVIVDQNRPQEYEVDPVPDVGATGSLILPFISCFRVYAYNEYGHSPLSDLVCPMSRIPKGEAPNLVVLVHGCCTDANDVIEVWDSLGKAIADTIIQNTPAERWEIVVLDWSDDTPKGLNGPDEAIKKAIDQSLKLSLAIAEHTYMHIHLIGASTQGSATLCFSRWIQRRGRQLHGFQYRRKHRARLLTEKALRCRRPVRAGNEKVVNGGETLSFARQIESAKLMTA